MVTDIYEIRVLVTNRHGKLLNKQRNKFYLVRPNIFCYLSKNVFF